MYRVNILGYFKYSEQAQGPQYANTERGTFLDGCPHNLKNTPHDDLCRAEDTEIMSSKYNRC